MFLIAKKCLTRCCNDLLFQMILIDVQKNLETLNYVTNQELLQVIAKEKTGGPGSQSALATAEISGSNEILFNPNVFTEFKLAGSEEASSCNCIDFHTHMYFQLEFRNTLFFVVIRS